MIDDRRSHASRRDPANFSGVLEQGTGGGELLLTGFASFSNSVMSKSSSAERSASVLASCLFWRLSIESGRKGV
jgi:hypothetical protein